MEEDKREEKGHPFNNSSPTPTTMAFPDENLNTSMSTSSTNNLSFPFEPADMSTIFDEASSSFGFTDDFLSTVNDYSTPTFFDWIHTFTTDAEIPVDHYHPLASPENTSVPASSEVQQNTAAASPNSFSISSSSNEAAVTNKNEQQRGKAEEEAAVEGDDRGKGDEQDEDKTEQQVIRRKKKEKQPRYAFKTHTQFDNLDDGYRWRKYGQKAVKNSPFARSYYRCTTVGCKVKKRVERSPDDFSVVVTTYEGNHNHPSIPTSRTGGGSRALNFFMRGSGSSSGSGSGGSIGSHSQQFLVPQRGHQFHQQNVQLLQAANLFHQKKMQQAAHQLHHQQNQNVQQAAAAAPLFYNNSTPPLSNYMNSTTPFSGFVQDQNHGGFGIGPSNSSVHEGLLRNDGLLEDILVPNQMRMRGGSEGLI